jgi:Phage integrase family
MGWSPPSILFTSERDAPFTTAGFARMVERAGAVAGFEFKAHPHMLRHACGFALANKGHDTRSLQAYLGHFSTPCATPNCRRTGLRTSGAECGGRPLQSMTQRQAVLLMAVAGILRDSLYPNEPAGRH